MSDFESTQFRDDNRGTRIRNGHFVTEVTEAQIALMIEEEVERRVSKMEEKLMLHMDQKFAQLHRLISDAFPGGDPHGHRMAHEKMIASANNIDKLKGDILSKMLTGVIWLGAGWLALAAWDSFKAGVAQ